VLYNQRMPTLDLRKLNAHRVRTYRLSTLGRVRTARAALHFINARGFIYFWPIKGIEMPSLWTAVAGSRVVADKHDDPGHITWGWKDNALGKKKWYYAKVLRRKATMISLQVAPYFYALSENYGSPEEDYLLAYEEGRLTQAAKQVYEALLREGPLHTIDLRNAAKLTNARESEFNRALETLQSDFKILPVGVAKAGAWKYAFIYEIVSRHYPDLPDKARFINEAEARRRLLELYFESLGAAQEREVLKLFGWHKDLTARTTASLLEKGTLVETEHPSEKGDWFSLPGLAK
ncbi:MAG TPA: crosslink repair DNA glycosylase YcaQ family protein, partial [Anaerolineales bacterium]|nr:crosslink repair DNA glycosylase YcaQ family protein [Anaerolineales bacterium]